MPELLLHPKTTLDIARFLERPSSSILISGVEGSGKATLASRLAAGFLQMAQDKLTIYGYFMRLDPEGDTIGIDDVRSLQQFLKLKVPSSSDKINRVVIIDRAERLRNEAQNALLKTLEEPPAGTAIMLTASHPDTLLPTITSRTQELTILPVSEAQATDYFRNLGKKGSDIAKYYALSQGQAGLLHALLDNEDHPLIAQVSLAKDVLSEPAGKRLLRTADLARDKQQIRLLLNAFSRIAHAALASAAKQQKTEAVKHWRQAQAAVLETTSQLNHNPNTKLLLDSLFLHL